MFHATVPVTAGGSTVALEGRLLDQGQALAFLENRSLSTLFVPFGNGGLQGQL